MNDHVNPIIARALAPFTPPDEEPTVILHTGPIEPPKSIDALRNSMVVDCPACDGGWRDTATGTVMCGQCMGTGRRATNGGEP